MQSTSSEIRRELFQRCIYGSSATVTLYKDFGWMIRATAAIAASAYQEERTIAKSDFP
jgi:hypothetical protein